MEGLEYAQWLGEPRPPSMIPTLPPGAASTRRRSWSRSQDDALILIRAALAKVAERIQGMDAEELAVGQIPAALRTLIELEFKVLGYEDRVALTGKDGGPVKTELTGKDGGPVKTRSHLSAVAGSMGRDTTGTGLSLRR